MKPAIPKQEAFGFFRLGLVTGLVDKASCIAWADREIMQGAVADADVIEVSLAEKRSHAELIWLLSYLEGSPHYDLPLRLLFAQAGVLLEGDPDQARTIILGLRLLNEEEYLPNALRAPLAGLREDLARCQAGAMPAEDLCARLAVFLDGYADARPLLQQVLGVAPRGGG
jgi:hypothetical protein